MLNRCSFTGFSPAITVPYPNKGKEIEMGGWFEMAGWADSEAGKEDSNG